MASADDLLNALSGANSRLDDIKGKLDNLKVSTDAITSAVSNAAGQLISTLNNGFSQLVALGNYTNQALYQNVQQNETIICELTHIAKNTCELLNESVVQTRLQTSVEHNVAKLDFLYATVHAEAEVERVRLAELRAEIERCCPPPRHEPPCTYTPCEQPQSIGAPPTLGASNKRSIDRSLRLRRVLTGARRSIRRRAPVRLSKRSVGRVFFLKLSPC